jgi:membrane-bound ClpP family serine protease
MSTLLLGLAAVLAIAIWLFWESLVADLANWALEKVGMAGRKDTLPGLRSTIATVKTAFVAGSSDGYAVGTVEIKGELWQARCPAVEALRLEVGGEVVVESREGLTISVRPIRPVAV